MLRRSLVKILWQVAPFVFLLFIWQILSSTNVINSQFLPSPTVVIKKFYELLFYKGLVFDILQSVKRVVVGFTIATIVGLCFGFISGNNKYISKFITPLIELFRPIPPIAWIPLAILWFGLGDSPAYFLVFLGSFFPIFSSTYLGVISVEEPYKRAAKNYNISEIKYITDILLPSALPYIFSGLKIGLGVGWMVVIVAELVGAQSGLGYIIATSRMTLETPSIIVGMAVIGIIGYAMNIFMNWLEYKCIPWVRPTE